MSLGVVDSIHVWHYCDWLETQPKQASHFIPLGILRDKECRRDILFHTPGTEWGWRPRKGWRDLLIERGQVPVEFLTRPGDEELAESLSRMVGGGPVQREMRPSGHTIDDLPIGIPPGYDIFGNVREGTELFTTYSVAKLLGLPRSRVQSLFRSGVLKGRKTRTWWVESSDLLAYAASVGIPLALEDLEAYIKASWESGDTRAGWGHWEQGG